MGIDPSLTGCGLVMIVDGDLKVAKTVSTPATDTRGARLTNIASEVDHFWEKFGRPDFVAMEGYAFGSPFNREEMGEVGGVIKLTLFSRGIEPVIWPNTSWKKAVLGKGNVKKEDLKLPVFQRYGVEITDMNQVEAFCVAQAEHLAQIGKAARPVVKTKRGRGKKASSPPPGLKGAKAA
jgi:Holliday junction resolvasome RuvABC endonuclease subunit